MIRNIWNDKKKRQLIFILLSFSFFSLSRGLWYNYQNLWMQDNYLSIKTISIVVGLASLLSVSVIFLFSGLIRRENLKKFVTILLFIKMIFMGGLFFLNASGYSMLIKFLIMADLVADTCIITCMYPVICLVEKSDVLYSLRGIISNICYDLGVFFSSFFLGKFFIGKFISYNGLLLLAFVLMIISFLVMCFLKLNREFYVDDQRFSFLEFFRFLEQDLISRLYFLYVLIGNICYYSVVGLKMLMLTDVVGLDVRLASNYLLIVGAIANIMALLILRYFTCKNYFINVLVKFGGRFVCYLLMFIFNNPIFVLISLIYTLLFSEAYSHITDAPYINRVPKEFHLDYVNLKGMISYFAQAFGIWICGIFLLVGIRYLFFVLSLFIIWQIFIMMRLNYYLKLDNSERS